MEPTLASKMKKMKLNYEDLEAARTLISISTPRKNMDDDTLVSQQLMVAIGSHPIFRRFFG